VKLNQGRGKFKDVNGELESVVCTEISKAWRLIVCFDWELKYVQEPES
jgi:hypothetical protein